MINSPTQLNIGMLTGHISRRAAGVWEVIQNLSNSLSLQGQVSTSVWGLNSPDTKELLNRLKTNNHVSCNVLGPHSFGFAPGLSGAVEDSTTDVLHSHGTWMYPSFVSYRWARRNRKPVIISPHGMLDPWALKKGRWKKALAGALYETDHLKNARCLHALCMEEALGIRRFGVKQPICVVPNGVHIPDAIKQEQTEWINEYAKGRNILLYLGRLHPKKGLESLLRALRNLKKRGHPLFDTWVTLIAGDSDSNYKQYLGRLSKDLGLDNNVSFIGSHFDQEKQQLFAASEAFILPSYSEGLPVAVLEAWAHSLPCLITPACHLQPGYKREAAIRITTDINDITRGLGSLMDMRDEERKQMGLRGKSLVKKDYSWNRISRQMLSVYQWTLGGPLPQEIEVL